MHASEAENGPGLRSSEGASLLREALASPDGQVRLEFTLSGEGEPGYGVRYSHDASLATRTRVRVERQPVDAASVLSCTIGLTDRAGIHLEPAAR